MIINLILTSASNNVLLKQYVVSNTIYLEKIAVILTHNFHDIVWLHIVDSSESIYGSC